MCVSETVPVVSLDSVNLSPRNRINSVHSVPPFVRVGCALLTLNIVIDRGRDRVTPPTFKFRPLPSFPPVWVKSIRTTLFTTRTDRCACPADMITWRSALVRLSGDERPERKTRFVHEHLCPTRTSRSELRSQHPPLFTLFHPYVEIVD